MSSQTGGGGLVDSVLVIVFLWRQPQPNLWVVCMCGREEPGTGGQVGGCVYVWPCVICHPLLQPQTTTTPVTNLVAQTIITPGWRHGRTFLIGWGERKEHWLIAFPIVIPNFPSVYSQAYLLLLVIPNLPSLTIRQGWTDRQLDPL